MAKETVTRLIDDLSGGPATESLAYAFDGVSFEVDLNEENARAFRDAMAPWVGVSRRVPARGGAKGRGTSFADAATTARSSGRRTPAQSRAVRVWARSHGYAELGERGRIPAEVLAAYDAAQADAQAAPGGSAS